MGTPRDGRSDRDTTQNTVGPATAPATRAIAASSAALNNYIEGSVLTWGKPLGGPSGDP